MNARVPAEPQKRFVPERVEQIAYPVPAPRDDIIAEFGTSGSSVKKTRGN
jgi:hypothetical protein